MIHKKAIKSAIFSVNSGIIKLIVVFTILSLLSLKWNNIVFIILLIILLLMIFLLFTGIITDYRSNCKQRKYLNDGYNVIDWGERREQFTLKNGKYEGEHLRFKNDELVEKLNYKNDLLHGECFLYYPNTGSIWINTLYENNRKVKIKSYYENGTLWRDSNMDDNVYIKTNEFYNNGKLKFCYDNGKITYYNSNNIKLFDISCVHPLKEITLSSDPLDKWTDPKGVWTSYNIDGGVDYQLDFTKSTIQSTINFEEGLYGNNYVLDKEFQIEGVIKKDYNKWNKIQSEYNCTVSLIKESIAQFHPFFSDFRRNNKTHYAWQARRTVMGPPGLPPPPSGSFISNPIISIESIVVWEEI